MSLRKVQFIFLAGLGTLLFAAVILIWPPANVEAQCGSQASSCKNCHEVQAQMPVNNDGTGWHQSHAFGDFCYICHAGNNQSMDKTEAHTGMVAPLSDVKAACQGCHPNDLMDRANVYAAALGVTVGEAGQGAQTQPEVTASETMTNTATTASVGGTTSGGAAPTGSEIVVSTTDTTSKDIVNYNQRYAETVLGQRFLNWGNIILVILIILLVIFGGAFVFYNERKRRGIKAKPKAARVMAETELPEVPGYSPEVVALLPKIAKLNPTGLHALKRLLEDPDTANELLHNLSRMDMELINQVRNLDRPSRELLLAMSGD